MTRRLKVGVIGAGVIAQVMHLNHLRELDKQYEVTALCDIAFENAKNNANFYDIPAIFEDWNELLKMDLEAILVLTSGSHAAIAIAAAKAGKHVLTEKPMCFSVAEGKAMQDAFNASGTTLMVAYPKRYDPAFLKFRSEALSVTEPNLLRVTTFESPMAPYIEHYRLAPMASPPKKIVTQLRAESTEALISAIGTTDETLRRVYQEILLDSLIHEINIIHSTFGEPDSLDYVDLNLDGITAVLRFGKMRVVLHWMNLPGMTRYKMEFSCFGPDKRVTLSFPSPFLRNAPAILEVEQGTKGSTDSTNTTEVLSYQSGFKLELIEFYDCVITGRKPVTDVNDGLRDIALCQAMIRSFQTGNAIAHPSKV